MKRIKVIACFAMLVLLIGSSEKIFSSNIFEAIKNKNLSAVKVIVEQDNNYLKKLDENKYTVLHLASELGHLKIVRYLIEKGAEINSKNHQENTPLHLASIKKHFPIVKCLVLNGADVNIKNFRGRIPALAAIITFSKFEIIEYLINKGSDINTVDFLESTLLLRACSRKYPKIVDLLLKKNIKLPIEKNKVNQLIAYSFYIDHLSLLNLLLKKNPHIKLKDKEKSFVLMAVSNGSIRMLKLLIEKKFNLQVLNIYGNSTIHLAAQEGFVPIVKILLENEININIKNKMGKTALHIAKEKNKNDMIEFLIKNGADQAPYVFPVLKGPYLGQKPPVEEAKVFALGIVSVEGLEHSPPVFSRDGSQVFWASEYPTYIIEMSLKNEIWTQPKKMPFNSGFGDGEPVFSKDNNKLFFLSKRTRDGKSKADRERIWYVKRVGNSWSRAICLNDDANLYPMHWTISIDDEDSIYFSSTHASGYGKHDIYKIKTVNGEYQKPVNLGPVINSKLVQITPFIAPDQSFLIYAIMGHSEGMGSLDLFVSFKKADGTWSKPSNLGESVNSPGMELCPSVSPDGKYLFFLGGGDINWVSTDIIKKLKLVISK